jgi:hypothetical protein
VNVIAPATIEATTVKNESFLAQTILPTTLNDMQNSFGSREAGMWQVRNHALVPKFHGGNVGGASSRITF